MNHAHDIVHVFIRLRLLLRHPFAAAAHDDDPLPLELLLNGTAAGFPDRLGSRHDPAGAMAAGTKRLRHGPLRADEQIGIAPHVAWDDHRLADGTIIRWNVRMAWGEGAGGAFTMHAHGVLATVHLVSFELRNVVRHIVDQVHAELFPALAEDALKHRTRQLHEALTIRPRVVGRTAHRAQVRAAFLGSERRTGQLTIRHHNPIFLHRPAGHVEIIVADLVPETSGAGVDHERDLAWDQPEDVGGGFIIHRVHRLDLGEMIPRP